MANANRKTKFYPWDSTPPVPIPLFQTKHPIFHKRHKCIAAVRERQLSTLKPLLDPSIPVLLLDPAYHENVGDHMITVGEHVFLERLGWNTDIYTSNRQDHKNNYPSHGLYSECHYVQASELVPHCVDVIGSDRKIGRAQALLHGGGNWGDLWPSAHKARIEQSFRALSAANYSIIGMPQSLHYRHRETETFDARLLKRELRVGQELAGSSTSEVVLFWREYESYDKARMLYPFVQNALLPDIAFQLGPYKRSYPSEEERVDFVLLLRRDHESTLVTIKEDSGDDDKIPEMIDIPALISDAVHAAIQEVVPTRSFRVVDWPDRLALMNSNDPYFTATAIQLLSMGRVLICDRLHAAILAFLSEIPFVYLDQSTGKISKCLRVALDNCGVKGLWNKTTESLWFSRAENLTDAIVKGEQMMSL